MTLRLLTGKPFGKSLVSTQLTPEHEMYIINPLKQTQGPIHRLQEKLPDDRMDSGRVPRTIDCEVTRDLVDRVIPGDVVEFTGIVKVSQSEKCKSLNITKNTNI
jgi:DNA replicative helicase MCM subunit Mcm2 (Cdc46/Mcm family)